MKPVSVGTQELNNGQTGPKFTPVEISKLESLAAWNGYYMKAYEFVHSYHRGAEQYKDMSEKQTLWLWRIKGEMENLTRTTPTPPCQGGELKSYG